MIRQLAVMLLGCLLLSAAGCARKMALYSPGPVAEIRAAEPGGGGGGGVGAGKRRYIAERHNLDVITPESDLRKSWESAVAFCGTIQCEVVSSRITGQAGDALPSGFISLRVAPTDLAYLLAHLQKLGTIAEHSTEREDKTDAVIDTDAKIANLTSFRDNLRAMLARPSATVKDLIEIQQQLTETQSELDSETGRRKALANETEKIAVVINLRVQGSQGRPSGWAEIRGALRESGLVLAESTATLITVIIAVIPWLLLIVFLVWLLAKGVRRLRRRRTVISPAPPPAVP